MKETGELAAESAAMQIRGSQGEQAGRALTFLDFDGDGLEDVAIGAPFNDTGGTNAGAVYVFAAGDCPASLETAEHTYIFYGAWEEERAGEVLAAGDLNNDGIDDLAIGAPNRRGGDGRVYIVFGNVGATTLSPDVVIDGAGGAELGSALGIADLDGDGREDLVVGAPQNGKNAARSSVAADSDDRVEPTSSLPGMVALYYGRSGWPTELTLGEANARIAGENPRDRAGYSLLVRDLTGDGQAELAIASPFAYTDDGAASGVVYTFLGGQNGWETLTSVAQADGWTGGTPGSYAGWSLGGLEDALVVGAPGYTVGADGYNAGLVGLVSADALAQKDVPLPTSYTGAISGDQLGASVAGMEQTLVIAATTAGSGGVVTVYRAGNSVRVVAGGSDIFLGESLALAQHEAAGLQLAIGAPGSSEYDGEVFLFLLE